MPSWHPSMRRQRMPWPISSRCSRAFATFDVALSNASYRVRGAFLNLDPGDVAKALAVTAYGGFLVGQQAPKRMVGQGSGAIFFTGASASIKGYARSLPFAMASSPSAASSRRWRASCNRKASTSPTSLSTARNAERGRPGEPGAPGGLLDPAAIAETYVAVLRQPRSAWSLEVDLRPRVETF